MWKGTFWNNPLLAAFSRNNQFYLARQHKIYIPELKIYRELKKERTKYLKPVWISRYVLNSQIRGLLPALKTLYCAIEKEIIHDIFALLGCYAAQITS